MALTRLERQITWSAASSVSVTAAGQQTSDVLALNADCAIAAITLKADNAGTPAAGDSIDFYLAATAGDPDGAGANEYPTAGHLFPLATIDTNVDDPGIMTVEMPAVPQTFQIVAKSNASANGITVSATVEELRVA